MNAKVEEFINKMKEQKREEEKKVRDAHLISLGLVDGEQVKISKVYPNEYGWEYDEEKDVYYKGILAPIEVTDEEYEEILKYAPKEEIEVKKETPCANTIKTIANILLVIHILLGLILTITLDDFAWFPITVAILYSLLYYPLILGFSKIVAASELKL